MGKAEAKAEAEEKAEEEEEEEEEEEKAEEEEISLHPPIFRPDFPLLEWRQDHIDPLNTTK